jgi:epoxyqueuosine reductase
VSSNSPARGLEGFLAPSERWSEALAAEGFDVAAGIDLARAPEGWLEGDLQRWRDWLSQGAHASMRFMEANAPARADARFILEDARSALVVLVPYALGRNVRAPRVSRGSSATSTGGEREPNASRDTSSGSNIEKDLPPGERPLEGFVARYARGDDYHKVIKKRLDAVARAMSEAGPAFTWRSVVDSIPFFDRAHAREAGLGFVGKNTMFIRPGLGSWFFVATLLLDAPAEALTAPDRASHITELSCGTCRKCLDACPTGALPRPYFLDAGRCLSYLTIENRDLIPEEYLPYLRDTLYGCDACQDACPYNLTTVDLVRVARLREARVSLRERTPRELAAMTPALYEAWFGGSAMTRAKYGGLVRNALCFLYAWRDDSLPALLAARKGDTDPLVARTCAQLQGLLAIGKQDLPSR